MEDENKINENNDLSNNELSNNGELNIDMHILSR